VIFPTTDNTLTITDSPVGTDSPAGPGIFDSFKDSMGRYRTQSLFVEHPHESYPAYFTLKKQDHKGKISLYRKYMEIGDPTEYKVAIQILGSWDHWEALKRSKWFMVHLTGWREELKVRMESERYYDMLHIQRNVKTDSPQAVQATKWLADRYGDSKDVTRKAGRPSKEEKAAHLKQIEQEQEYINEDVKRLGLV